MIQATTTTHHPVVPEDFSGLLSKPPWYNRPWGHKMRISKYWFRVRAKKNNENILYSMISLNKGNSLSTSCICDLCKVAFNRSGNAKKHGFDLCDMCDTKKNGYTRFTKEVRKKISEKVSKAYSDPVV